MRDIQVRWARINLANVKYDLGAQGITSLPDRNTALKLARVGESRMYPYVEALDCLDIALASRRERIILALIAGSALTDAGDPFDGTLAYLVGQVEQEIDKMDEGG